MRHSGYRRVSSVEQIIYIITALIRRKWARIFEKEQGGIEMEYVLVFGLGTAFGLFLASVLFASREK